MTDDKSTSPVVLPVVARLREYVQHKRGCDKRLVMRESESNAGFFFRLSKAEREKQRCTCGLDGFLREVDAVLAACPGEKKENVMKRNWHSIVGPNGMCECGVKADGTVVTCGKLLEQEVAALTLSEGTREQE